MALTSIQVSKIKAAITATLTANVGLSPAKVKALYPVKNVQGKLYEVHVLAHVLSTLTILEGCKISLVNVGPYRLKQKGGPVNRSYPYFKVERSNGYIGDIFTDTEFTGLSYDTTRSLNNTDYHELDIAMFNPGVSGRPNYLEVIMAIECKATKFEKSTFREILGFRRELSFLDRNLHPTPFKKWFTKGVMARPASIHMCFSTDATINKYDQNAEVFGIQLFHEKM